MKPVEKCGICGEPFDFDPNSACGIVQTTFSVPHNFSTYSMNFLSKTSRMHPMGMSLICIACADALDASGGKPAVKYLHNEEGSIYRAYDVSQFAKVSDEIIQRIKAEVLQH